MYCEHPNFDDESILTGLRRPPRDCSHYGSCRNQSGRKEQTTRLDDMHSHNLSVRDFHVCGSLPTHTDDIDGTSTDSGIQQTFETNGSCRRESFSELGSSLSITFAIHGVLLQTATRDDKDKMSRQTIGKALVWGNPVPAGRALWAGSPLA